MENRLNASPYASSVVSIQKPLDRSRLEDLLRTIAGQYPPDLVTSQLADVERMAFNIGLVVEHTGLGGTVCDIGGGLGLFSVGCAALGLRSILVDDFGDQVSAVLGECVTGTSAFSSAEVLRLHRSYGVEVLRRDVIAEGIDFDPETINAITVFHTLEHWHNSPKKLLASVIAALVPGGTFVLQAPNSVNLRKRLTVPLGFGNWSRMEHWYEAEQFRGHVREPDVHDLRYIARDMGLANVRIVGRNWLGYWSQTKAIRAFTRLADRALRLYPPFCSDLYLIGSKPDRIFGAVQPGGTPQN
jgi:SAM-dependent methyltransferase